VTHRTAGTEFAIPVLVTRSEVRAGRRERAEAYAFQAAEAARRGDHRQAAVLYQAAFLALETKDESGEPDELSADDKQQNAGERCADWLGKSVAERPGEAE
jgi:hypothetical protein